MPEGVYFSSIDEVEEFASAGQAHYMRRAFHSMKVDGILCVDGKPSVYLKSFKEPLQRAQVNDLHKSFWNQSTATLLILQDPHTLYIFSGMIGPENNIEEPIEAHNAFVDKLERIAETLEHYKLIERITNGEYYRKYSNKFHPKSTVDRYLIHQLIDLSDGLAHEDTIEYRRKVNSFIGQLIFTCYLIDRGIISLDDYHIISSPKINTLLSLFEHTSLSTTRECLTKLFTALRDDFNGNMFEDEFESELSMLGETDFELVKKFLQGEKIGSSQMVLGFWAYDFSIIPVETISAIYEALLGIEDPEGKRTKGAFYTPRHLAEMLVDEAVSDLPTLLDKRFLDPSCGSGIFLVTLFNRIANEWNKKNNAADEKIKIDELSRILKENLYGVDVNPTACRITCFSLYVALLDQLEPRYLRMLQNDNGKILPKLLAYETQQWQNIKQPSIFEGNFFSPNIPIHHNFDVIISNPPWPGRTAAPDHTLKEWLFSEKTNPILKDPEIPRQKEYQKSMFHPSDQDAHAFMWKAPLHLRQDGLCCMLLPSEVLLNKTDIFQKEWLKRTTVDRIIQLADYRRLLFEGAIRPCFIAIFRSIIPDPSTHEIEYMAPKYLGQDPRVGKIPILSDDIVMIPLKELLHAAEKNTISILWKSRYTGSPRDWRLLNYLQHFPKLSDLTGKPNSNKRWKKGKGFQVWYQAGYERDKENYGDPKPIPGSLDDFYIEANQPKAKFIALSSDCTTLGKKLTTARYKGPNLPDSKRHASLQGFRRSPQRCLFEPPLVLINKGFNRVLFADFFVFYQESITGISGPDEDEDKDLLLFLAVYAQSRLASYFQYHTAGSWGVERPEVKVHELLRLPFPLPGNFGTDKEQAQNILSQIVLKVTEFKEDIESEYCKYQEGGNIKGEFRLQGESFDEIRHQKSEALSRELGTFVYQYFGLTDEEIALVEETYQIYEKSATPDRPDKPIPTLRKTTKTDRTQYTSWLCRTLNKWASEARKAEQSSFNFTAESTVFHNLGQILVTFQKSQRPKKHIDSESPPTDMVDALQRISKASLHDKGSLSYLRGIIFADKRKIHILKPNILGKWTRTAALNDAQRLFDIIISSQKRGTWK